MPLRQTKNIKYTRKDALVLSFIKKYIDDRGFAPLNREIAAEFGWGQPAANHRISRLCRLGFLRVDRLHSRGIRVVAESAWSSDARHHFNNVGVH
jgi:SOS-response transcriptional repressor LexA